MRRGAGPLSPDRPYCGWGAGRDIAGTNPRVLRQMADTWVTDLTHFLDFAG